jgi:hypothetical protein
MAHFFRLSVAGVAVLYRLNVVALLLGTNQQLAELKQGRILSQGLAVGILYGFGIAFALYPNEVHRLGDLQALLIRIEALVHELIDLSDIASLRAFEFPLACVLRNCSCSTSKA